MNLYLFKILNDSTIYPLFLLNTKLYKKSDLPPISFKHKTLQEVSDQFLILGDNGSGKTTILQAIALPLSLATKKIQKVSDFNWIGFLASRYWRWGIPHIELEISFVDEEISATKEVAEIWYNSLPERSC